MEQFEKWLTSYNKGIKKNFWCILMKPFMEDAWKTALEWVLLLGSDDDVLYNKVKDELYGNK